MDLVYTVLGGGTGIQKQCNGDRFIRCAKICDLLLDIVLKDLKILLQQAGLIELITICLGAMEQLLWNGLLYVL